MDFKVGDLVVCIDSNSASYLESGLLYKVDRVYITTVGFHNIRYLWNKSRFKKVKKIQDTKIARLLCPVYKEEDGYLYI